MRTKIIKLFITFTVLFSLQSFSQAKEKSKHPLLDKYYPRKQVDTPAIVTNSPKPLPAADNTPAVKTLPEKPLTKTQTSMVPENASTPALSNTTTINKPSGIVEPVQAPVQKQVQSKAASPPYNNRLGSSTPQYNTWEKNNNGAGSVTTSPK